MKEFVDQGAHFTIALILAAVVLILAPHSSIAAAGAIGLMLGVTREVTEGGNVLSDGSRLDLLFWTLGGLAAGIGVTIL